MGDDLFCKGVHTLLFVDCPWYPFPLRPEPFLSSFPPSIGLPYRVRGPVGRWTGVKCKVFRGRKGTRVNEKTRVGVNVRFSALLNSLYLSTLRIRRVSYFHSTGSSVFPSQCRSSVMSFRAKSVRDTFRTHGLTRCQNRDPFSVDLSLSPQSLRGGVSCSG